MYENTQTSCMTDIFFLIEQNQTQVNALKLFCPLLHNDGQTFRVKKLPLMTEHLQTNSHASTKTSYQIKWMFWNIKFKSHSQQNVSCGTITDAVVVLRDHTEIKEAFKRAASGNKDGCLVIPPIAGDACHQFILDTISKNRLKPT